MLINCPKCGFSQPQDKYCAQCGVDMESYKPKEPSGISQFFSSLAVQVFILLIIGFVVGLKLYQNKKSDIQERVRSLKGNVQIVSGTQSSSLNPSELQTNVQQNIPETTTQDFKDVSGQPDVAKDTPNREMQLKASNVITTPNDSNQKVRGKHQTTISYYEVSIKELDALIDEGKNVGQFNDFGDYKAGVIGNLNEKLTSHPNQFKSFSKVDQNLEVGKVFQWFVGTKGHDADADIGFHSSLELSDIDNQTVRGTLEIIRSWKEINPQEGNPIVKTSFPAVFEIRGENTFFISGLLPRKTNLENDDELLAIEPFKMIKSPRFKSEDSELIIFIQVKR